MNILVCIKQVPDMESKFKVNGEGDWYDSSDRLRMKLGSLGVPFEAELDMSAGGHGWEYFNQMAPRALDFIIQGLDQERRRVG